jgi:hypothetical protein
MYSHVFSPFHRNTLPTDAGRLHESSFGEQSGLLGLFYARADADSETAEELPERHIAADVAEKIVRDINYWYEVDASVCSIGSFSGLQHAVHKEGAVISRLIK